MARLELRGMARLWALASRSGALSFTPLAIFECEIRHKDLTHSEVVKLQPECAERQPRKARREVLPVGEREVRHGVQGWHADEQGVQGAGRVLARPNITIVLNAS